MPAIDETVTILRDDQWQYVRIPLSVSLPEAELHLHRATPDGPITLSKSERPASAGHAQDWDEFFRLLHEAHAAGETFELERDFCPPRDIEIG